MQFAAPLNFCANCLLILVCVFAEVVGRDTPAAASHRKLPMGVMRFLVQPAEAAMNWPESTSAYITALDGRVFQGRAELSGNVLSCTRASSESGKLHVAWPIPGLGRPVLTTASLPESEQPYLLTLELARGRIGELRDQAFQWQFAGMVISPEYTDLMKSAFTDFSKASASRSEPLAASQLAHEARARRVVPAKSWLGPTRCNASKAARRRRRIRPRCSAARSTPECLTEPLKRSFFQTFSAAAVPIEWSRVEPTEGTYDWQPLDTLVDACLRRRCVVRGGPLLDLSPAGLPTWLCRGRRTSSICKALSAISWRRPSAGMRDGFAFGK